MRWLFPIVDKVVELVYFHAVFNWKFYVSLEQTFHAIRRATGLQLCVKIFNLEQRGMSEAGLIEVKDQLHSSKYCLEVKRSQVDKCIECDLRKIPGICSQQRQAFFHTCHAGATEMIIPVHLEKQLSAIVYIGQFRVSRKQPSALPLLSASAQEYLLGLAPMVAAYLAQLLRTPRFERETSQGYRKEIIVRFLMRNLSGSPDLSALATHLGLSPARTAHVVREACEQSFVSLRDELRLQRAKDLLQSTGFKVSQIAVECGFSSSHYFHRFFQKHMGLSPGVFRNQHRLDV